MKLKVSSPTYGEKTVVFDDEDWPLFKGYKLMLYKNKKTFYCSLYIPKKLRESYNGKESVKMHFVIMGAKEGYIIDHANTNGLDNRRANLRWANPSQSGANRNKCINSLGKFKGVHLRKDKGLFWAHIRHQGKLISGGSFKSELLAAKRYNELAVKYYGEYASLNKFTEKELALIDSYVAPPRRLNINNITGYRGVSFAKMAFFHSFLLYI